MATKFGPQPVRDVLRKERWTIKQAAAQIGVEYPHLVCVVRGTVSPKPEVRERLPKFLNCKLEDLFTPEVIARKYWHRSGVK